MVNPSHEPWTKEEEARLTELVKDRKSVIECAGILERSKNSIAARCKMLTLKPVQKYPGKHPSRIQKPENENVKIIKRKCLNCQKKFNAEGKYLRTCPTCRKHS